MVAFTPEVTPPPGKKAKTKRERTTIYLKMETRAPGPWVWWCLNFGFRPAAAVARICSRGGGGNPVAREARKRIGQAKERVDSKGGGSILGVCSTSPIQSFGFWGFRRSGCFCFCWRAISTLKLGNGGGGCGAIGRWSRANPDRRSSSLSIRANPKAAGRTQADDGSRGRRARVNQPSAFHTGRGGPSHAGARELSGPKEALCHSMRRGLVPALLLPAVWRINF